MKKPDHGRSVRRLLLKNPHCHWCGAPVVTVATYARLTAPERALVRVGNEDHVVPRSRGGRRGANIVLSCVDCNMARGDGSLLHQPWEPARVGPQAVEPPPARRRVPHQPVKWVPFFVDAPPHLGMVHARRWWYRLARETAAVNGISATEAATALANQLRNRAQPDSADFGLGPQHSGETLAEWAAVHGVNLDVIGVIA